jgi:hypothetical protein
VTRWVVNIRRMNHGLTAVAKHAMAASAGLALAFTLAVGGAAASTTRSAGGAAASTTRSAGGAAARTTRSAGGAAARTTLSAGGAAASTTPASYCARQDTVFSDRHAVVGISDPYVEAGSPQFRDCSFGLIAADHIGVFRGGLSWAQTEDPAGHYVFAAFDELVSELARHHIRFLPVLLDPPRWRSTQPAAGTPLGMYPPAHPAQFAAWAAVCVRRYGPHGSFWRANPALPYLPVRAWEVWNEPNIASFWAPRPNARAYVSLLRATARAIRRVDRHATIVTAGMPFAGNGDETAFVRQLYRAGARSAFNVLALHTYARTVAGAVARLQTARRLMNRFGDRRKQIWDTEWSWAGGPPNPFRVSQTGQRANVSGFLRAIQRSRRRLRIGALIYYGWRDTVYGKDPSWWGYHVGLYTQGLQPKLALGAFARAARGLDQ